MSEPGPAVDLPEAGPTAVVPAGDLPLDGATDAAGPDASAPVAGPPEAGPPEAEPPAARRRSRFYLRGRSPRLPRSRRGLFALLLVLGGLGGVATFSAVSLIQWTETADFCGRCHTMAPELAAYEAGPHRDVACAECHVEPGIMGWVKAKLNGTRQLVEVILGTFPEPIPPPEHSELPAASDTCMRCHDVSQTSVTVLRTTTTYAEDQANTPQFVGLLVRPTGGNPFDVNRSVHWHVLRTVTYASSDPRATTIDYVAATTETGQVDEFIAYNKIRVASNVQPDIDAIKASERMTVMSCYDCHNRAGHAILNPRTELDAALSTKVIDPTLPWIKSKGMEILWATYPDFAAADAAADGLLFVLPAQLPDGRQREGAPDR